MGTREEIEGALMRELESRREAYSRTKEALHYVASGIHPDAQNEINMAISENSAAREALRLVLNEFNEFILNGLIPDHLRHLRRDERTTSNQDDIEMTRG